MEKKPRIIIITQKEENVIQGYISAADLQKLGIEIDTRTQTICDSPVSKEVFRLLMEKFMRICENHMPDAFEFSATVVVATDGITFVGEGFEDDEYDDEYDDECDDECDSAEWEYEEEPRGDNGFSECTIRFTKFDELAGFCKVAYSYMKASSLYRMSGYNLYCKIETDKLIPYISLAKEFHGEKIRSNYSYAEEHELITIKSDAAELLAKLDNN